MCLSLQPLTASYIKITHLWFRLAKCSVPLVLSPWRILLVAFLLTAMIEFKIILHLLGSSSTISHVSISSLFQDRQGCCDGNFQEFHYITESFSFWFCLKGKKKKSNGLGFHSRMRSTCLYKRLWLVFSGLVSKTECYFIADIMYEFLPLPFHIASWVSETWEFSLNYLSFVCTYA